MQAQNVHLIMQSKVILCKSGCAEPYAFRQRRARLQSPDLDGKPVLRPLNQSESENEANFTILILYGRVLRNFFISSLTCASFER
jgi:hypothetical protein